MKFHFLIGAVYAFFLCSCNSNRSNSPTNTDTAISRTISSRYNTYYSSKTNIDVEDIPIDFGSAVRVGKGVNLEDPNNPVPINNDLISVNETPKVQALAPAFSAKLSAPIPYDSARKHESVHFLKMKMNTFLL